MRLFWGPCVCSQAQNPKKLLPRSGARGKINIRILQCRLPDLGLIEHRWDVEGGQEIPTLEKGKMQH